jgi:hypothetical protein
MVIPEMMFAASGDSIDAISYNLKNYYIRCGLTSDFENSFNLIQSRVAWKHSLAHNKLSQNTAYRPHIYGFRILSRPE